MYSTKKSTAVMEVLADLAAKQFQVVFSEVFIAAMV